MKFGQLAPLTGPSANLGALIKDGATVAAQQINAAGGVLGKCLQLIVKDDQGDATKAAQVTRELVDQEQVALVVGPVLSGPTATTLEVTTKVPVVQMVQSSLHAASIAKDFPYSFMNEFTQAQSVDAMVAYLSRQGFKSPVAFAVNNPLGTYYADEMPKALEAKGLMFAAPTQLFQTGSVDLTPQMRTLVAAKPDVILAFEAAGPDYTATVKARNQLAPGIPIVGIGAAANLAASGALSAAELDKVYSGPFPKDLTFRKGETTAIGTKAKAFLTLFQKFEGGTLKVSASQAARAYDQVYAAAAAIEGTKSTKPDDLKTWFESHTVDGAGGTFKWTTDSHAGQQLADSAFVVVSTLKNGILQLAPGEGN
jgi:branched-chain amino acid transport system substrate-binding protein